MIIVVLQIKLTLPKFCSIQPIGDTADVHIFKILILGMRKSFSQEEIENFVKVLVQNKISEIAKI